MHLNYEQIRTDGGTQPRAQLQQDTILEYQEAMQRDAVFPPLTVFFDGQEYWLADGFHRLAAAMRFDPPHLIECDVRQGSLPDAQWFSYSANKQNGLHRSNEDKRRAVVAALSHSNGLSMSDSQIAHHCGVSQEMVRTHRARLTESVSQTSSQLRTGRDGRTINTTKIGRNRSQGSAKPRKTYGGISPKAFKPIRAAVLADRITALSLPLDDPKMGANTLISLFDANYLRVIVEVLSQHLTQPGAKG